MSTQNIYDAVIDAAQQRLPNQIKPIRHLDIGAGRGELIRDLQASMLIDSSACDFHTERFCVNDIPCQQVDLNLGSLPYQDDSFSLVTCSEVVEHLENYRALLRETYRITVDGGVVVVTTPNVLNANSRIRYLLTGFANLFGPLPLRNDKRYSTGGHITPIPYFYLAHAILDAGYEDVRLQVDKAQKTSIFWTILLAPFLWVGRYRFMRRERMRFMTITRENEPIVAVHFSWLLLVGRTLVVSASKRSKSSSDASLSGVNE